jgi:hypothetical protein
MAWLAGGRTSYLTKITQPIWGLILAIVGLVSGFVLTTFTLVRCRNSWQLLLLGMWKMSMSLLNGLVAIHVGVVVYRTKSSSWKQTEAWIWAFFRVLIPPLAPIPFLNGCIDIFWVIIGFTGLMSLISHHWTSLTEVITLIFAGLIGVTIVSAVVFSIAGAIDGDTGRVGGFLVIIGLASLYADCMLGAMVGNLVGLPSGDNALVFWLYFASKRLNMLNF